MVRLPVLDVGLGAYDIEVAAHERGDAPGGLFGDQLGHAGADARQVRHLCLLLGSVLLTRVEVCGDHSHGGLAPLGTHDGLEPTARIHVRLSVVENRARLALQDRAPASHSYTHAGAPLDTAGNPHAVPGLAHDLAGNLLRRTHFLHQQHIRIASLQPVEEATLVGGANAVEVHGGHRQSHRFLLNKSFLQSR